jgi:hypothetical protein
MAKPGQGQGDGKNSPFVGSPGTSKGTFNPQTGQGTSSGKAPPFDQYAQQNPQQKGGAFDIQAAQTPAGGPMLYADPPGNAPSAADVGTTAGANRPPFRLKG